MTDPKPDERQRVEIELSDGQRAELLITYESARALRDQLDAILKGDSK